MLKWIVSRELIWLHDYITNLLSRSETEIFIHRGLNEIAQSGSKMFYIDYDAANDWPAQYPTSGKPDNHHWHYLGILEEEMPPVGCMGSGGI